MAAARQRGRSEDFHAWRKRVKALWYDLRLIHTPSADLSRLMSMLHKTQDWLGDDHNAAILCERLEGLASGEDAGRVRAAAARYQRALRQKALATGARLYARRPTVVLRSAARAWRASH